MELSYIFSKESFYYISENRNTEKFLYFKKWNLHILQAELPKLKKGKFLTFLQKAL